MKVYYNLSTILDIISDPEMPKPWRKAHFKFLDGCSPVIVSGSDSDLLIVLKHWTATHKLDGCSPILFSGYDQLKYWSVTHWLGVHPFLSVVLICSSTGERLTS